MSFALLPPHGDGASMPSNALATNADLTARLRLLRACQGMVGIADDAMRWVSAAEGDQLRAVRLECVIAVAPRALRDDGTAQGVLRHAVQAEIWMLGKGASPSPVLNQKSRSNNSVHAPNNKRSA